MNKIWDDFVRHQLVSEHTLPVKRFQRVEFAEGRAILANSKRQAYRLFERLRRLVRVINTGPGFYADSRLGATVLGQRHYYRRRMVDCLCERQVQQAVERRRTKRLGDNLVVIANALKIHSVCDIQGVHVEVAYPQHIWYQAENKFVLAVNLLEVHRVDDA